MMDQRIQLITAHAKIKTNKGPALLTFFRRGRTDPVSPYAELIADYDAQGDWCWAQEECVNELFTRDEVDALAAYLAAHEKLTVRIEPVTLPITHNMPLHAIPVGGDFGRWELKDNPSYLLPFEVSGLIDYAP